MTARIIAGTIRTMAQYGDAEVRQRRIDQDRAIGIRDDYSNTNARVEMRLWGSRRTKSSNGSRQVLCTGRMHPATMRNADQDDQQWNGGGHRGIVWASNDGEWIDEPLDDAYMIPTDYSTLPERIARYV